ncbi:hypothetical protein MRX96_020730 [Rhipicephalus microplus]
MLNDSSSIPTYENKYNMSWIDVTFATRPTIAAGYSWRVREDVTHSEHRYLEIAIGRDTATRNKRLTRFAGEQLLEALNWEPWFDRLTGAQLQWADALELGVSQFYHIFEKYRRKHLRPAHQTKRGNSWWTPELAQERKHINAMRCHIQRCKDDALRSVFRAEYSATLAAIRRNSARAREAYLKGFSPNVRDGRSFGRPTRRRSGEGAQI